MGCGKSSGAYDEGLKEHNISGSSNSIDGFSPNGMFDNSTFDEETKSETTADVNENAPLEDKKDVDKTDTDGYLENQKLIYECDLEIQTLEFEKSVDSVNKLIKKYNGFIESNKLSDDSYDWFYDDYKKTHGTMFSFMTVRIPSELYSDFLKEVGDVGKIIEKNEEMTNITKTYNNTLSVIKMLEKEESLLLEMMNKAKTISDMITIEERLSEVQRKLAIEKSSKETMDSDIAFSTVNIQISEVVEYSKSVEEETFFDKITKAVKHSIDGFGNFVTELCILFILLCPYLIIIVLILFIIFRKRLKFVKNINKKCRFKKVNSYKKNNNNRCDESKINNQDMD